MKIYVMYGSTDYEGYGPPSITLDKHTALKYLNDGEEYADEYIVDIYESSDNDVDFIHSYDRREKSEPIQSIE